MGLFFEDCECMILPVTIQLLEQLVRLKSIKHSEFSTDTSLQQCMRLLDAADVDPNSSESANDIYAFYKFLGTLYLGQTFKIFLYWKTITEDSKITSHKHI